MTRIFVNKNHPQGTLVIYGPNYWPSWSYWLVPGTYKDEETCHPEGAMCSILGF
jgi:hypothetical protein